MKMSVCVDALWPAWKGHDPINAVDQAAAAGARTVEIWSWWDKDLPALQRALQRNNLMMSALCTRFISLVDRATHDEYLRGLEETIAVAKELSCPTIITQVGGELPGLSREVQHQNLVAGLMLAEPLVRTLGMTLVLEPLNALDHQDYYLRTCEQAACIVAEVDSPNVKMLYDIYHQQVTEGDILASIERHLPAIGHMHCAGVPGRHELEESEIDYRYLFSRIEQAGYDGYMALELFCDHPAAQIQTWCANAPK